MKKQNIVYLLAACLLSVSLQAQLPKIPKLGKVKDKVTEVKDKVNDTQKPIADDGNDPIELRHLKSDLSSVRSHLADNEPQLAAGSLILAKQNLGEVKKNHPDIDVSAYEKEIADFEKTIGSDTQTAESKEDAISFVKSAALGFSSLIPQMYSNSMYTQFKSDAQSYYNDCKEADYAGTKKKMDGILTKYPELRDEYKMEVNDFYKFSDEYTTFSPNLIRSGNGAIEEAYAAKKNNQLLSATETGEIALLVANSILTVLPANPGALRLKTDAEKVMGSTDQAMGSKYTSTYHKQNAGKFIFSKNAIILKQENESTGANSFTLKDHIYGMAYLKGTIKELTEGGAYSQVEMQVTLFIDGNELGSFNYPMTQAMESLTAFPFEILPDPNTATDCAGAVQYAKLFAQSSPREHELKFRFSAIYLNSRKDLVEGACNLDLSDGQETLDNLAALYHKRAIKNVFMPKPAMTNPGLSNEMMAAAKSYGIEGTPVKAVITETGWTIYRHPLTGIVTDRKINGAVSVKLSNGDCKLYNLTFIQEYAGGAYSKTRVHSYDSGTDIDCDNAKK